MTATTPRPETRQATPTTCLFGEGGYCVRHGEFCQGKRTTDEEREADRAAGKHYPHDDKGRPQ